MRNSTYSLLFAILALTFLQPIAVAETGFRGITVNLRSSEKVDAPISEKFDLYAKSYALVIGIDEYDNGWPRLSNAVADAVAISSALEAKGFEVEFHKNLSSNELNTVFKRFFILKGDDPSSRLFIWFAGHGTTVDGEGYLIPRDAPLPTQGAEFKYASVALRDFGTFMRQAVSKHVYAVFDSCFAGTVFSSQRAIPPAAITRATTFPVRQFLTSGDVDQTVSDDGVFRELFIRAINGDERSDANGDGYVTASELGMFLGDRVTNLTESQQTPRYGKLRDKNFDRGDFVFVLPENAVAQTLKNTPITVNRSSAELLFWDSIKNAKSRTEFDAYLKQYPEGPFVTLALLKRDEIVARQKAAQRAAVREEFKVEFMDHDLEAIKVANVRQAPFPSATRVGRLKKGTRVWAIGETKTRGGVWYRIARDGMELGFVYSPLLASISRMDERVVVQALAREEVAAEEIQQQEAQVKTIEEMSDSDSADRRLSFLVDDLLMDVRPIKDDSVASANGPSNQQQNSFDSKFESVLESHETAQSLQIVQTQLAAQDQQLVQTRQSAQKVVEQDVVSIASVLAWDEALEVNNQVIPVQQEPVADDRVAATNKMLKEMSKSSPQLEFTNKTTTASSPLIKQQAQPVPSTSATIREQQSARIELALLKTEPVKPAVSEYVQRYIRSAEQGNSKAQLSLGYMYEMGQQVSMNKTKAALWYRRAAEAGEVQAMLSLGLLFERGEGVTADLTEAAYWYKKAANSGNADAQQTIGYMYEKGEGIARDETEAARWYEKAALQGRVTAQNNLGRLYQLGIGVNQDTDQAIFWYRQAAEQGNEAAQNNLDKIAP